MHTTRHFHDSTGGNNKRLISTDSNTNMKRLQIQKLTMLVKKYTVAKKCQNSMWQEQVTLPMALHVARLTFGSRHRDVRNHKSEKAHTVSFKASVKM